MLGHEPTGFFNLPCHSGLIKISRRVKNPLLLHSFWVRLCPPLICLNDVRSRFKFLCSISFGLIMGGVTPRGVKIKSVKGGINNLSWVILTTINRSRSGSFCFKRNQEEGVTLFSTWQIRDGDFALSDFFQHFFRVSSRSLTRKYLGFKKKKERIIGKGNGFSFNWFTIKVIVYIWLKSYQFKHAIFFFSSAVG